MLNAELTCTRSGAPGRYDHAGRSSQGWQSWRPEGASCRQSSCSPMLCRPHLNPHPFISCLSSGFSFNLLPLMKKNGAYKVEAGKYDFYINVCGPVIGTPCTSDAGACQVVKRQVFLWQKAGLTKRGGWAPGDPFVLTACMWAPPFYRKRVPVKWATVTAALGPGRVVGALLPLDTALGFLGSAAGPLLQHSGLGALLSTCCLRCVCSFQHWENVGLGSEQQQALLLRRDDPAELQGRHTLQQRPAHATGHPYHIPV